jgi:glycosyltransferase involved in cell wall biosynthesis
MQETLGAKKSFWNHRGGYDNAGVLYNPFLVRRVARRRPAFLANSAAGARFLREIFGLALDEVKVIPNTYGPGVEDSKEILRPPDLQSKELSLIHVANFFPEKDYDTVLRAVRLLDSRGTHCRVHFCGEFLSDSDRSKFFLRLDELGIRHSVVHHGATTSRDLHRLLLESDIGLLSSKSEGQPNCIIEYMAVGLPVVATKIPGIQEIIGEENEKYLFNVGDAEGLARLISDLKEAPDLRAKIGLRNRIRITEHFAPERVLPQWAALVEGRT